MTELEVNDRSEGQAWLAGGGITGARLRAKDWSSTSLGAPAQWPHAVRTAVSICLHSRLPILLVVGSDQSIIYNDAFVPFLGGVEQSLVFGEPTRAEWGASWERLRPTFATVLAGEAASVDDVSLRIGSWVSGEYASARMECSPILAADGTSIDGAMCTCVATSAAAAISASEQHLRAAADLIGLGSYRSDPTTQSIEWDANLKAIWGLPPDAPVDFAIFLSGIHPDDRERVQAALGQSVDPAGDGICDIEYRVTGVNGGAERWVLTRGKTVFENNQVVGFHGVALDISKRKRAEQTNLLLIAELEHRTRNLLAVVSALSEQTLASCTTLEDFSGPFTDRLASLSRVQGLVSRGSASPATIGELVELELRALGAEPNSARVTVSGPEVALPTRSVQILALALHELATNARKHGALGSPDGELDVTWQLNADDGRRLTLDWRERGLAARTHTNTASHVGLGRMLIEKSLPYQLDAKTKLEIGGNEVHCLITMALE